MYVRVCIRIHAQVRDGGYYRICTMSDDGSKLWLDDELVVNNDGLHGPVRVCSSTYLARGMHRVKTSGFQAGGGAFMTVCRVSCV
jgi:hexosaminidase